MKIERRLIDTMPLDKFADRYGLVLEVVERREPPIYGSPDLMFYAHFKNVEVKEGAVLRGAYGNGRDEAEAIADYARELSRKQLVVDAYRRGRLDISAPDLTPPTLEAQK